MVEPCYVVVVASASDSADIIDTFPFPTLEEAERYAYQARHGEFANVYAQQSIQVYVQEAVLLPDGDIVWS